MSSPNIPSAQPVLKSNSISICHLQKIGIGVGLYADYGPKQKLYFHSGYSPDAYGVIHKYRSTVPGESYPVDDELILWLTKDLS